MFFYCRTLWIIYCWFSSTTLPWVYICNSEMMCKDKVIEWVIGEQDKSVPATFLSQPEEATEPTSALVPFLQKYSDTRNRHSSVRVIMRIIMQFVLIICRLTQFYNSIQVPRSWTRVESTRLVFNMYFYSALIVFVLSPGAKAGVEGNQRTARPSLSLHELPEARRGCSCAPVLPCSR